jgi:hypothetical protein
MRLRDGVVAIVVVAGGTTFSQWALDTQAPALHARPSARQGSAPPQRQPSIQDVNDRFVRDLSARLADRENQPSHLAFKNIKLKWFKDVPAKQLLDIMDGGYARALGVRCTHCHVADDFASDEKRPKRAAREMATMHWDINQRLARMAHLTGAPQERFINCATCHRGSTDPHDAPQ